MKNFILLFTMFLSLNLVAKEPPKTISEGTETVQSVEVQPVVDTTAKLPETLWVVIDGDSVGIPTKDGQIAVETVKEIIEENKGNWPTSILGWVTLVLGILFSARGTVFMTSARGIYNFLKTFLRKTLHVVAFVAGAASAGVTFLIGRGEFDWQMFTTLWGITSFLGVYIYETWIKKPESEPEKKAKK